MKFYAALLLIGAIAFGANAQRPRTVDTSGDKDDVATNVPAAPQSVKAKYEGGIPTHRKKQDGILAFDDTNNRLTFQGKEMKDPLFIPYSAISQAFGDTQSRQPTAAEVAGSIPVPYGLNLPARFIKKKYRYLTLQFFDEDSQFGGLTSFKMDSKQLVESMAAAVANKAGLVQKGDIYVRDKTTPIYQGPAPSVPRTATGTQRTTRVEVDPPNKPSVFVENEVLSSRIISLPRPNYPEEAKGSKVSGTVRVLVTVDERGRVEDAEAVSGPSMFQAAAVDAAKLALFEPVIKDGKAVKTKAVIAYTFATS